jgi:signal peptidase
MNAPTDARHALGVELVTEVVSTFGGIRLRVTGTSMLPAVQPGDLLTIHRVDLEDISLGEIVLVVRGNRFFAHRVLDHVRSDEPYLTTRGDRLSYNDPPVFRSELLGKVAAVERNGRKVGSVTWLNSSNGVLAHILRSSESATCLFVRLTAFRRALGEETMPRS